MQISELSVDNTTITSKQIPYPWILHDAGITFKLQVSADHPDILRWGNKFRYLEAWGSGEMENLAVNVAAPSLGII